MQLVSARANANPRIAFGSTDVMDVMSIEYLGLWVLLALSLNMWALLSVVGAQASLIGKVIWAAVLFALPGIAFILWYLFGPRRTV